MTNEIVNFPYLVIIGVICFTMGMIIIYINLNTLYVVSTTFGVIMISLGSFLGGSLFMISMRGIPLKISWIRLSHEIQLEKRIDQSLSLVKMVGGNDKRVVKGIPIEIREGDVFMIKKDGSIVVLKTLPNSSPIGDGIGGY